MRTSPGERDQAIAAALGGRSVVLVGMMGAGKTAVGKRLALRLGLAFRDADAEIEAAAQKTIPEIFEVEGEAFFRDKERRVVARLLGDGAPLVLATGGRRLHERPDPRGDQVRRRLHLAARPSSTS